MSYRSRRPVQAIIAPRTIVGTVIALAVLAIAVVIERRSGLNLDVAWYLQVAMQLRDGVPLYLDAPGSFIEVNPPLVIWALVPPLWLAERRRCHQRPHRFS